MRNNNHILHGDQTRCEKKIPRSTTNLYLRQLTLLGVNLPILTYTHIDVEWLNLAW